MGLFVGKTSLMAKLTIRRIYCFAYEIVTDSMNGVDTDPYCLVAIVFASYGKCGHEDGKLTQMSTMESSDSRKR